MGTEFEKSEKSLNWNEPPRISGLFDRFLKEGMSGFSPAELTLILHLLSPDQKSQVAPLIQKLSGEFWTKHMPVRRVHYRNVVDVPSTFRHDVTEFISPKEGDEIVDMGAGTFSQLDSLVKKASNLNYIAIDRMPVDTVVDQLNFYVEKGDLNSAQYIQHDLSQGFPKLNEKREGVSRIGIAVASIGYFPADALQKVVKEGFETGGLDRINYVALRPDFDADNLINRIENVYSEDLEKTEEGKETLRLAREGYEAVRAFGKEIAVGLPVRSPEETASYINRVAKVSEIIEDLSTETFGLVIIP